MAVDPPGGTHDEPPVFGDIADLEPYVVVPSAPVEPSGRVRPFVRPWVNIVIRTVPLVMLGAISLAMGLVLHGKGVWVLLGAAAGAAGGALAYLKVARTRRRQIESAMPIGWTWESARASRNRARNRRSFRVGHVRRVAWVWLKLAAMFCLALVASLMVGILPAAIDSTAGVVVGAALLTGALVEAVLEVLLIRDLEAASGWRILTVRIKRMTLVFRTHWASRTGFDLEVAAFSPWAPVDDPGLWVMDEVSPHPRIQLLTASGRFDEAAEAGVAAYAERASAVMAVDIAWSLALAVRDDEALEWLDRAADDGLTDLRLLRRTWAFAPLRHTREMRDVMDRVRANAQG